MLFLARLSPKAFKKVVFYYGSNIESFRQLIIRFGYDLELFEVLGNAKLVNIKENIGARTNITYPLGNHEIFNLCSKDLFLYLCELATKNPKVFDYIKIEDLRNLSRKLPSIQIESLTAIIKSRIKK